MATRAEGKLPVVAIIGRPNVGKSTLFNRICGGRKAIVHDRPGVTRDRLYQRAEWAGTAFSLVDTGGFDLDNRAWDADLTVAQARLALAEAAAVIFLVDAAAGLTPQDREVAAVLRKGGARVFLAANKVDHGSRDSLAEDFGELGFHPIHRVSAEHGLGIGDLLDEVVAAFPRGEAPEEARVPRIAIVGRPNLGKSTLANRFMGEERFITHHEPGTTRDAVDSRITVDGREYVLVDTAGIRRRGKIQDAVEKYSVLRAREAIERSDICFLLIDAAELAAEQDAKIAGMIQDAQRSCLILVNKWDLMAAIDRGAAEKVLREQLQFMDWAPILFISGKTGQGTHKIFPLVNAIHDRLCTTIPASKLNDFLYRVVNAYKPSTFHGKPLSLGYMTQVRANPPTFVILTNEPTRVHFTYRRYLANRLREEFDLTGVPVILRFRKKK